ncbi:DNA helicase [Tanacetum coccineum]
MKIKSRPIKRKSADDLSMEYVQKDILKKTRTIFPLSVQNTDDHPVDKCVRTSNGLAMGTIMRRLPTEYQQRDTPNLQITRPAANRIDPYSLKTCNILGISPEYSHLGQCTCVCRHCGAMFWECEKIASASHTSEFGYNNVMFSMTSLGANVDKSVNNGRGPYVFRMLGQLYHWIGSLCPEEGQSPSKLHPCYMSLQFPLLFVYGEDGYKKDMKLVNIPGQLTKVNKRMSMNMYYSYQIHDRLNHYNLLLHGGKLFQQYVVTAYCAIEQTRLDFIRQKQDDIRSEYLSSIYDAILRGDRDGSDLGLRAVLTASFTGSPRYMYAHYLDALAICRVHGSLSFFITFTCNTKWPEIEEFIKPYPQLTVADRADIIDRVFEKKVHDYIDFVRDSNTFGPVTGVLYTIEFQKRGLPHCHSLLWINDISKVQEDVDVDKYVCAELPDPTTDPNTYAVISELMIHGPCGSENPSATYIRKINNKIYPTNKAACQALGLLSSDQEWVTALEEASLFATAPELRKLFVYILIFCNISDPLQLWNKDFALPMPPEDMLLILQNRLLMEETNYDQDALAAEKKILIPRLNKDQRLIFDEITHATRCNIQNPAICFDEAVPHGNDGGETELLYPPEYLNSLNFAGFPPHRLEIKVGSPIILLRNLNISGGLCNGTRLIVTQLLSKLCYAMITKKSQGQSLERIGIFLPRPVFAHGQLYVALSRATSPGGLKILIKQSADDTKNMTKNIVYKDFLSIVATTQTHQTNALNQTMKRESVKNGCKECCHTGINIMEHVIKFRICKYIMGNAIQANMDVKDTDYFSDLLQLNDAYRISQNFDMDEYNQMQKPVIIAIASAWATKKYGGLQLSSTSATHYYLNPNIPEATYILDTYANFITPTPALEIQRQPYNNPLLEQTRNRYNINTLLGINPQHYQVMGNDRAAKNDSIRQQKDKTAIAFLYQALPEEQLLQITKYKTAKAIWDALKTRHIGEERVQQARLQTLKSDFEMLHMKEDEAIDTFTEKLTTLVNKAASLGHTIEDSVVVRKLLNAVPEKFLQIVASIEQYSDLDEMSIDELSED